MDLLGEFRLSRSDFGFGCFGSFAFGRDGRDGLGYDCPFFIAEYTDGIVRVPSL